MHSWVLVVLFPGIMGWNAKSYPNLGSEECASFGPFLCDPDHLLTEAEDRKANEMLGRIHSETPCDCHDKRTCRNETNGFEVAIALLRNIEPLVERAPGEPDAANAFVHTLRLRWNLGHCGDDVLITICDDCEQAFSRVSCANAASY